MSEIGFSIRSKQTQGEYIRLTLGGGISSSCAPIATNELPYILHALSNSRYTEITDRTIGFPYTFPIVFGY